MAVKTVCKSKQMLWDHSADEKESVGEKNLDIRKLNSSLTPPMPFVLEPSHLTPCLYIVSQQPSLKRKVCNSHIVQQSHFSE